MRPLVLGAPLVAALGCYGVDLVSPAANAQPALVIALSVNHRDTREYRLDALLSRGTDAEGRPRAFIDSTLGVSSVLVEGAIVYPRTVGTARNLQYPWDTSFVSGIDDMLSIRPPVVAGVGSDFTVEIPIAARASEPEFDHVEGADLEIVLPPDLGTSEGQSVNWSLEVRRQNSVTILRLSGATLPPPVVALPWELIAAAAGDTLFVNYQRTTDRTEVDTPYRTRVLMFLHVAWRIAVVTPGGSVGS